MAATGIYKLGVHQTNCYTGFTFYSPYLFYFSCLHSTGLHLQVFLNGICLTNCVRMLVHSVSSVPAQPMPTCLNKEHMLHSIFVPCKQNGGAWVELESRHPFVIFKRNSKGSLLYASAYLNKCIGNLSNC